MAKIFTITFTCANQPYSALVSMVEQKGRSIYTVQLSSTKQLPLFFLNKLSYTGSHGYKELKEYSYPGTREILDAMAQAVEKYATERNSVAL